MINFLHRNKGGGEAPTLASKLDMDRIPRHVAIIMDGNGRWAKRKNRPRSFGHKAGADTLKRIVTAASDIGVKVLTVYAFSTENWKRPESEVSFIMNLMKDYLGKNLLELHEHNVKLHIIGDQSRLSPTLREAFADAEAKMAQNTGLILNVAVNYGGRLELTQAMQRVAQDVAAGTLQPQEITDETIGQYLYTAPFNDVDLLIRPGADKRVSNFLLWQMAYAEFWFTDLCWPDFTNETLYEAILSFQGRERRFGGLK